MGIIVHESTPRMVNEFRHIGKRYNQLLHIRDSMLSRPKKSITIISLHKGCRKEFLELSKSCGFTFEVTPEEPWGNGCWQFTIKSMEVTNE